MKNLEFAYHYLNFNGDHANVLPQSLHYKIRKNLANGFGKIDSDHECFEDMLWDWSHVRDSSEEALDKIAGAIRDFILFGKKL